MKVGLVVEQLDPRRGGVEQWTWQFCSWLLNNGHEVHIVGRGCAAEVANSGAIVHTVEAGNSRTVFAAALADKLRTLSLDVVHDTGCGWHCDVLQPHGGSRAASFEQNLLLSPNWLRPLKRHATSWLPRYREFDELTRRQYHDPRKLFMAISKMVAHDLMHYHHVSPGQVRLVYNGVDTTRFSPAHRVAHRAEVRERLKVADHETLLLIVAHNFRLKGVSTLVRATGRLIRAGHAVRLAVVGGRRFAPYERLAAKHGCRDAVQFLGSLGDPVPMYAAADVYVQPTYYDPCSLVLLEAIASGLPVITSRFNGAGELLTPGVEGDIIDDPGNDEELAASLSPLMDANCRAKMGLAARRLALDHTLEHNSREVVAVYEEVVHSRRRAA